MVCIIYIRTHTHEASTLRRGFVASTCFDASHTQHNMHLQNRLLPPANYTSTHFSPIRAFSIRFFVRRPLTAPYAPRPPSARLPPAPRRHQATRPRPTTAAQRAYSHSSDCSFRSPLLLLRSCRPHPSERVPGPGMCPVLCLVCLVCVYACMCVCVWKNKVHVLSSIRPRPIAKQPLSARPLHFFVLTPTTLTPSIPLAPLPVNPLSNSACLHYFNAAAYAYRPSSGPS